MSKESKSSVPSILEPSLPRLRGLLVLSQRQKAKEPFNNYVDKMRGGEAVKKYQNSVHVVVE
jgi:hypothetical protein